jgi:hypothetical protein
MQSPFSPTIRTSRREYLSFRFSRLQSQQGRALTQFHKKGPHGDCGFSLGDSNLPYHRDTRNIRRDNLDEERARRTLFEKLHGRVNPRKVGDTVLTDG